MPPRSQRVPTRDGLSLHVLVWSDEGVPLLFLHGFANEAHVWDDVAPVFAPYYRTLAFDLPGHGDSDRDPARRYDHESMARDVASALDALGAPRVVLVGHSMGGRVAMRFAGLQPERLAGLVVVDAGPELDARGVLRIRLDAESGERSFASRAEAELALRRAYPLAGPAAIARLVQHTLRERSDGRLEAKLDPGFMEASRALDPAERAERERAETAALWAALGKVPCPALVIRGAASDVLSPETADQMVESALARGRLAVIPRAGHSVMLDNPGAFRDALEQFALGDA
jgi:pimeloyl-ACP methyl ester carboxylesterase